MRSNQLSHTPEAGAYATSRDERVPPRRQCLALIDVARPARRQRCRRRRAPDRRRLPLARVLPRDRARHRPELLAELDACAREFFEPDDAAKQPYAMANAGPAWRGWFPVRGELTSGLPDRKEGLYVGLEHAADHPRVLDGTPLHGANLFPPGGLGPAVLAWLDALRPVADALMRGDRRRPRAAGATGSSAPHRRPDRAVPDLPLPGAARQRASRRVGRRRAHRLRAADAARPGRARRAAGAHARRRVARCAGRAGRAGVQHRRHARPPHRGPLPQHAAPRAQPQRARAGCRSPTSSIRRGTPRSRRCRSTDRRPPTTPIAAGTAPACTPGPAATATT